MTRIRMTALAELALAVALLLSPTCKRPNLPPDTPCKPFGPTHTNVGISRMYAASSIDPDGDNTSCRFYFGNGDTSNWGNWTDSRGPSSAWYAFPLPGTFRVSAQGRDVHGALSTWSDSYPVAVCDSAFGVLDSPKARNRD